MARSARRKPMSEINMVPFIDIMMVMLVAFMVSSPMFTQGVHVNLPKSDSKPVTVPKGEQPLIVAIRPDGTYYLNLESTADSALSLEQLADKAARIKKAKPSTLVLVKGDEKASYGAVVKAMAALQRAGVEDVGLITEPGESN